jgi:3-oxoadipate enol-lactonase
MQFAELHGLVFHYRWSDKGRGMPVLAFCNAVGTDFRIWDEVSERLGESVSILLYDKRGHGLSDLGSPPYALSDHVDDLAHLLDHLAIGSAVICGLSVGGLIAQGLALKRPELVRGIILCCTALKIGTADLWEARIRTVEEGGIAAILEGAMTRWCTPAFRTPDNSLYAASRTMLLRQDPRGYAGTCAALRDADFTLAARTIAAPALCIAGDGDPATPPELVKALAEAITGSRFTVIEKCGHLPCLEQPAKLAALITSFIADLGKGSIHG